MTLTTPVVHTLLDRLILENDETAVTTTPYFPRVGWCLSDSERASNERLEEIERARERSSIANDIPTPPITPADGDRHPIYTGVKEFKLNEEF